MTPGGRKVSSRVRSASAAVAASLEIERGEPYLDLVRLRTADDEPMAITRSQLSIRRFPGIESVEATDGALHGELARRWPHTAGSFLNRRHWSSPGQRTVPHDAWPLSALLQDRARPGRPAKPQARSSGPNAGTAMSASSASWQNGCSPHPYAGRASAGADSLSRSSTAVPEAAIRVR